MVGVLLVFGFLAVVSVALGFGLYSLVRREAENDRTITDRASAERAARREAGPDQTITDRANAERAARRDVEDR